jgi:hypothetical protein
VRSEQSVVLYPILISALIAAAQFAHAQQPSAGEVNRVAPASAQALSDIVSRMEQAQLENRAGYRAYTLTRQYRFYGDREDKPNAEILADVSFVPPDRKTFKIQSAVGGERSENIVQKLLERESDAAAGRKAPGAITRQNYEFTLLGEETVEGQPSWVLRLKPKHDERDMIKGRAWVDQNSYLIHRIEGEMAKTPSWWLKKVVLTLQFGNAAGMWLQTGTHAVADVRLCGKHILNEQAVKIQTGEEVAEIIPGSPQFVSAPAFVPIARTVTSSEVRTHAVKRRPTRSVPPVFGAGIFAED